MFDDDQDGDTDTPGVVDNDSGTNSGDGGGGGSDVVAQPQQGAIPTADQGTPDVEGDTGDAPTQTSTPMPAPDPRKASLETVKRALGYSRRQFGIMPPGGAQGGPQGVAQATSQEGARIDGAIPDDSPGARQEPQGPTQDQAPEAQGAIPADGPGAGPGPGGEHDVNAKPSDADFVNRNVKDRNAKYVPYLMGAGAAPPQVVDAIEANIDRHNQMDPNDRKLAALQYAESKGGEKAAAGLLQSYRQQFDAGKSFATAALTGIPGKKAPDIQAATDAATKAFQSVPDGTRTVFSPSSADGQPGVTATVTNQDGAPTTYKMDMSQFSAVLRGRDGLFDQLLSKGTDATLAAASGGVHAGPAQAGSPQSTGVNANSPGGGDDKTMGDTGAVEDVDTADQIQKLDEPAPKPNEGGAQEVPEKPPAKKSEDEDDQPIHEMFRVTPGMRKAGISQALMNMSLQRFPWMSQNEQRADWLMSQANAGQANDLKKQELENKRAGAEGKGNNLIKKTEIETGSKERIAQGTNQTKETVADKTGDTRKYSADARAGGVKYAADKKLEGQNNTSQEATSRATQVENIRARAAAQRELMKLEGQARTEQERSRVSTAKSMLNAVALGADIPSAWKQIKDATGITFSAPASQAPQAPRGPQAPQLPRGNPQGNMIKDPTTGKTFEITD